VGCGRAEVVTVKLVELHAGGHGFKRILFGAREVQGHLAFWAVSCSRKIQHFLRANVTDGDWVRHASDLLPLILIFLIQKQRFNMIQNLIKYSTLMIPPTAEGLLAASPILSALSQLPPRFCYVSLKSHFLFLTLDLR